MSTELFDRYIYCLVIIACMSGCFKDNTEMRVAMH